MTGKRTVFLSVLIVAVSLHPKSGQAQSSWQVDRQLAADLRDHGVQVDKDRATLWFDAGALSTEQMDEFAALINQGILDIEAFLRVTPADYKIRYYISSQTSISHALGRSIFLPLAKVSNKTAPYLHETTHVVAPCTDCPMWFSEGFASYVQSYISEHVGGYDGGIFAHRGNRGIDRDAARWLANDRGQVVLPFLGRHGEPPEIAYDRSNVAAPFYVMAQSLVKFMVAQAGIDTIGTVMSAPDFDEALLKLTSNSSADWKDLWLASMAAPSK
jgi:hypothetical protein